MERYYFTNTKGELKKKRLKKKLLMFALKLTTLFILLGILGHLINKNSDFLKDMYFTYTLIQDCQDLKDYQNKYQGEVSEQIKSDCSIIGIAL